MVGFISWGARVDAQAYNGAEQYSTFRKLPPQATAANTWVDLSQNSGTGNPVPNYYASTPLVAATLNYNDGIYHGGSVSPDRKFLSRLTMSIQTATPLPMTVTLCDYLLYYPFVDMDSTDTQAMVNSVTIPRYTSGSGVSLMMMSQTGYVGGQTFQLNYVNQSGNAAVTPVQTINTSANSYSSVLGGNTANSQGPFVSLAIGNTGIRSVTDITFGTGGGGLCALVLVKPLATFAVRGIDAPTERDFFIETPSMPQIVDGAYLNFIACPNGSVATVPIFGDATFVWG